MSYENYSFENILNRMLEIVRDQSNTIDTREGSVIHDALAPASLEFQNLFMEMNALLNDTFADTASRDYLILRCAERGITPEEATHAILKGEFNINVPIGSRFSLNDLNYVVIEKIDNCIFKVQCETTGVIGNSYFGTMIPIEYIEGLETCQLTELLIPGEDEEDTEVLRERYFSSFDTRAFGGNIKDYLEKTNGIQGVGNTKVVPVWNGGGTVLLVIIDSTFRSATQTLIQLVKDTIDPMPYGTGQGLAPIGHVVTVQTVDEILINITSTITFNPSYTFERVKEQIESTLDEYMLSLRKTWANSTNLIVRISQIETRLLNIEGIIDVANTRINGKYSNLELDEYEIPIFNSIVNG